MTNTIFIKENFIKELTSSINTPEEVKAVFKDDISQGILNNVLNRKDYLKETCQALNLNENRLIFIKGFQGTGKTEFIKTLIYALEENVLNFYYECSSITHFDDIILSLFNYLKKIAIKNSDYKRIFKISNSQSIDERLINYIKSLNMPLLIIIDGFENFTLENITKEQQEIITFLEFLSSMPETKIIISGRTVNSSEFINQDNIYEVRLGGLEEQQAYKILKNNGIEENESGLQQIFEMTRGYPENLLRFSIAVNTLKISAFELMKEYYAKEQKSYEEFIYESIYKTVPKEFLKVINFFAAIRHAVNLNTLKNLNFATNISEKIDFLLSKMILTSNINGFYIKNMSKNLIYSSVSADEKIQIHRYLYEIYSEQISKKLEERIFFVSRKLLYSEQYYHYMCLINYGDKSLSDLKNKTFSNLKPDYKYLYANITDSLFVENLQNPSQIAEIQEKRTKDNIYNNLSAEIEEISDLKIELSKDEEELLAEETSEAVNINTNDTLLIQETSENEPNEEFFDSQPKIEFAPSSLLEEKIMNLKNTADVFYKEGKYDEAARRLEETLILYEIIRDKPNINRTIVSIANAYYEGFRHDTALAYYYRLLNTEDIMMEIDPVIESLCGIANIYEYRGDFGNAFKFYEKALDKAEKTDNINQKIRICFKKALTYDDFGNYDKALEFYSKSINLFKEHIYGKNDNISLQNELIPDVAASYSNMAIIYEEREDLNKAKECFLEALKYDKSVNNIEGQYETFSNIGNIYFEIGNYQKANDYFHECLLISKKLGDTYKIAMSCLDIGDIYLAEKNYEKALKAFIIAGKTIEKTISTDSREKIERRFKTVISEIGEYNFNQIIDKLKKKNG